MDSLSLVAAAVRVTLFGLILVAVGAVVFRWLILSREGAEDDRAIRTAARLGLLAATLVLPALLAYFAAQLLAFRDPMAPLGSEAALLLSLPWGRIWLLQVLLGVLLLICFGNATRGHGWGWIIAPLPAAALAFTPALSGHAAAVETSRGLAVAADGMHVLGAGAWLGTLCVVAASAFRRPRLAPSALQARLTAFSPIALSSAAVVAATGSYGAWVHLHRVADLWTTPYGRLLALKLLLFAGVVVLGGFNWRRATPRLRIQADSRTIARSIFAELATAVLVLLVTAWFVATSPPEGSLSLAWSARASLASSPLSE